MQQIHWLVPGRGIKTNAHRIEQNRAKPKKLVKKPKQKTNKTGQEYNIYVIYFYFNWMCFLRLENLCPKNKKKFKEKNIFVFLFYIPS